MYIRERIAIPSVRLKCSETSTLDKFLSSFFPDREIDNFEAGVKILRKGLFGLFAPLATALTLPKDLVKSSTITLVS